MNKDTCCSLKVCTPLNSNVKILTAKSDGIRKWDFWLDKVAIQSFSRVQLFAIHGLQACQASLSFTISQNLLKFMSIESVMTSNRLILCCPLLLLPPIFPSIRVFSNELALCIRWPKYWARLESS